MTRGREPRDAGGLWKPVKAQEMALPEASGRNVALLIILGFCPSEHKTLNLRCFKLPRFVVISYICKQVCVSIFPQDSHP